MATAAITIIHQSRLNLGSLIGCFDSVCCVCDEISDVCVVFMFWLGLRTKCSGYGVNRQPLTAGNALLLMGNFGYKAA